MNPSRGGGNPGPWILGLLAVAAGALITVWFLNNFERKTIEVETGMSAEARRNPLLAAQRLFERLGVDAHSEIGRGLLDALPPPGDTLIVNGVGPLGEERMQELHTWIEDGGHLMLDAGSGDARASDQFLAELGIEVGRDPLPVRLFSNTEHEGEAWFESYNDPVTAAFPRSPYLIDEEDIADGGMTIDDRTHVLRLHMGQGSLTVLSDLQPITNANIGEHDHALFLLLLTAPAPGTSVHLLYDSNTPWIGSLLWSANPWLVASVAGLILLTLWAAGARLGPLQAPPQASRRDLLAHLDASAEFHWRHGLASHQVVETRDRIEQAWLRRHPRLRHLNARERARWISEWTGMGSAAVHAALYGPVDDDERELVQRTATLANLQRWLERS